MIIRILAFIATLYFATVAHAQTVVWSTPGSACVPDQATIMDNRHKLGLASAGHAADNVGRIILNCPIAPFSHPDDLWSLFMNYRDSTGASNAGLVRARLYRMGLFLQATTPDVLATVTSNSAAATTDNFLGSPAFTHTFNFDDNTYWVRVELDRSTIDQTVVLHSVFLLDAP